MRSILQTDPDRCFLCQRYGPVHTHHVFYGPQRPKADKDGLTVRLCLDCHEHVHKYPKGQTNTELRREAQRKWMQYYGKTEDDFRKRYGRSVL